MFILNRIVWVISLVLGSLLLLSYLAPFVPPAFWWPLAFLGLAFPILFIVNSVCLFYWLVQGKLKFIFPAVILFLGMPHYSKIYKLGGKDLPEKKEGIRLVSMNVKGLGFDEKKPFTDSLLNDLKKLNPDFACFQEFWNREHPQGKDMAHYFKKELGFKTYRFNGAGERNNGWGTIVFTRYPAVSHGAMDFGPKTINGVVWIDVKLPSGDTVRVYSVHLQSNRLSRDEEIHASDLEEQEVAVRKSKNIIKRLKYGFEERSEQVEQLCDHIDSCRFPIILMGDLNDTQLSYTYKRLSKNKKDAFVESGKGAGNTYVGPFPSYRIDYIFFDKAWEGAAYATGDHYISDHKLISTWIYK